MLSLKKLLNKPKLQDGSLLSLFYYCDIAVNHQMQELNTLMRISPDNLNRRSMLIRQLKEAQHNLMNVIMSIADQVIPDRRTSRDFRAKYPDDVLLDQISGPIWFGAECIAAGSHIANHEAESTELRPYATHLSKIITKVRQALRVQSYVNRKEYPKKIRDTLVTFDELWADFEFRYVSLMCNVKTESQYYHQQSVVVLFCESTLRAIKKKNLSCEMIEMMDPSVMFAIPRMAILCGLAIYPEGPLDPSKPSKDMPHCFRAYRHLLSRIKELLSYLDQEQLDVLEQALCSAEGLGTLEWNKAATKKKAKQQNGSNTTSHSNSSRHQHADADEIAAATATSVATPPTRRPLEQSPPTTSTPNLALPTSNSHPQRRHSYNLDSRDAGNTVFEPLPVPNMTAAAIPVPVGVVELEEPFPNLGVNQPVENALPSASSSPAAYTVLPTPNLTQPAPPTSPVAPPSSSSAAAADTPSDVPRDDTSSGGKVTKPVKKPRSKGPAGFPSVEDLMHRLFLGISGVADQLQTNHAKDLRVILKNVFAVCQSEEEEGEGEGEGVIPQQRESTQGTKYSSGLEPEPQSPMISASQRFNFPTESLTIEHTPSWIPDSDSLICSVCTEKFSWKRRRHHCRSCGNVVCAKCSPNNLPLFQFGISKHVRVCTNCYISQLGQISLTITGVSGQPLQVL